MKNRKHVSIFGLMALLFASSATAQDPTAVDAKHYKTVFENDQVRVVRITYGAGEKSVMHYHPEAVAVFMTDNKVNFALPNGETLETTAKTGQAAWTPAGKHLPQNVGDQALEVVLVEMKGSEDAAALRSAIEAQNAKFAAAFNRGDGAGMAALYTENGRSMPPNSEPLQGREAIRTFTEAGAEMGLTDLTLSTVSLESSGNNTAYEIGTYTLKVPVPGKASMTDSGKYMAVWKKQADGSWKIHSDIWNSNLPLPGTN